MSDTIHRRIARLALRRGLVAAERLWDLMEELARRQDDDEAPVDLWLERGLLDRAQLADVLSQIDGFDEQTKMLRADTALEVQQLESFVHAETAFLRAPGLDEETEGDDASIRRITGLDESSAELDPPTMPLDLGSVSEIDAIGEGGNAAGFDSQMRTLVHESNERDDGAPRSRPGGPDGLKRADETARLAALLDQQAGDDPRPARGVEIDDAAFANEDTQVHRKTEQDAGPRVPAPLDPGERFVLGHELGSGGGGRVVRAYDRVLGRTVAMKVLRSGASAGEAALGRFIAEAQATGQLEHPNIVPIYDFGMLPSGEVFYTMREVRRHSLREVLQALSADDPAHVEEYTLVRLVTILRQVAQAIHYAHSRGVVHRDLKPDNIMVGEYGEVLVMDWGLARVLDAQAADEAEPAAGETLGTPAYMSPEQARGELELVDEKSDAYSLGAILYEILTLRPPFGGESASQTMHNVVHTELIPPSVRARGREVPQQLEQLCLTACAADRDRRLSSARVFADRLGDWIEGIQPREAARRVEQGRKAAERYVELLDQVDAYDTRVKEAAQGVEQWEPIERKRQLWALEDERDRLETESVRAVGEAVNRFTQALAYDPGNAAARQGLADLYWARFARAEAAGDQLDTIYFKALVEQYDDGKYAPLLSDQTSLRVQSDPPQANVLLFKLDEVDRRLVAASEHDLGQAPFEIERLDIGSYLLFVDHPECLAVQRPVLLERGRPTSIHIDLPDADAIEEGFVYVPGGEFIAGGDPEAFDPRPPERVSVDGFYCARLPVTFREYLVYFNEIWAQQGEAALIRAPQTRGSDGYLIRYDEASELWVPDEILIEGHARKRYPAGQGHEYDLPVVGVRAADALAYCAWRGQRDGRDYRLPTEHELEKAGRGVDGRHFPWGNRFDATFCKMRFSRSENPQLEPVGTFVDDVSPYGIRDLGGGVQEWCEPRDGPDAPERPVKGGGWSQDMRSCRMASRLLLHVDARTASIGFRLVYGA